MSVTRLVLQGAELRAGELQVPDGPAHHARVARVGVGEPVEVLNLLGEVAIGRLSAWEGTTCRVAVDRVVRERGEPPEPLVLALAVLHTSAFDWAVEKATELGASAVVPVLSERVQGRLHERRVERWRRMAEAAVAQCGRSRPPTVSDPVPFRSVLDRAAGLRLLADPGVAGAGEPLVTGGQGVTVLVGPEGGFTEDEVAAARGVSFGGLRLGPRTLRAETAAVAALVAVQQRLGWFAR